MSRFSGSSHTLHLALLLCAALWLLSGCFGQRTSTQSSGPQLDSILPEGWEPVEFSSGGLFTEPNTWQSINIDGDDAPEYLLFFTYDNDQVGAVIYDEQIGSTQTTSPTPMPVPNQPSGLYVPYRLEPDYWAGAGSVGYIAPVGTTSSEITFEQVARSANDVGTPTADGTSASSGSSNRAGGNNELIIHGGATVLTVVWWRNPYNGYGVTQIGATGGLVRPEKQGNDGKGPIVTITGLTPLQDDWARSVLCEDRLYARAAAVEDEFVTQPVYSYSVKYVANNRGIVFCYGPPPYPFYPEGVVLAFLRPDDPANPQQSERERTDYRETFVDSNLEDENQRQALLDALLAQIDFDGDPRTEAVVYVQELLTPPTLSTTSNFGSSPNAPVTTTVCAQVSSPDGMQVRRLRYLLEHIPPTSTTAADGTEIQVTDRFTIIDAFDVTAAPTCADAMSQELPVSQPVPVSQPAP